MRDHIEEKSHITNVVKTVQMWQGKPPQHTDRKTQYMHKTFLPSLMSSFSDWLLGEFLCSNHVRCLFWHLLPLALSLKGTEKKNCFVQRRLCICKEKMHRAHFFFLLSFSASEYILSISIKATFEFSKEIPFTFISISAFSKFCPFSVMKTTFSQ